MCGIGNSGTGLKAKRSHLSITNPARTMAELVSRAGWQPPNNHGPKVASSKRWM
jgi:hypothetical protein